MADLAAANMTVAIQSPKDLTRRRRVNHVTMTVGNGVLKIPAGGLMILPDKNVFGMATIDDMIILGGPLGYHVEYVPATHNLIWYFADNNGAGDAPLIVTTAAIASSVIRALVIGK